MYSGPRIPTQASEREYVPPGEYVPPLREIFLVLRQRIWIVILVPILCLGAAVGFSLAQKPVYESSITLLVGHARKSAVPGDLQGEVQGLQQVTQTVTEAVQTRSVAQEVIDRLNLRLSSEGLLKNMNAQQIAPTQFIQVSYKDTDPERAQRIANTIGDVFSKRVSEVNLGANNITATVWEKAELPDKPVSPKLLRNAVVALALGLMLGVVLAFLLQNLDDYLRSLEEVEQVSGVPALGVILKTKPSKGKTPDKEESASQ